MALGHRSANERGAASSAPTHDRDDAIRRVKTGSRRPAAAGACFTHFFEVEADRFAEQLEQTRKFEI